VRFGVTIFATDQSIDIAELARAVEERGFDSLWVPEHTHIPTSRLTPPPTGDSELAEEYRRTLDPWVALATAAAVTSRLRIGTGISVLAQHDVIATAKAAATLDHVSRGRAVYGVGFGWNRDEIEAHGVDFTARRAIVEDKVAAMRSLWADEVSSHHGPHVQIEPSWQWPKPVQRRATGETYVPVLLGGGTGPRLWEHLIRWADGWIPIGGAGLTSAIPRLHDDLAAADRDPTAFEIVPFGSWPDQGKVEHFGSIGVTETVFRLPSAGRDATLAELDAQATLIARLG